MNILVTVLFCICVDIDIGFSTAFRAARYWCICNMQTRQTNWTELIDASMLPFYDM